MQTMNISLPEPLKEFVDREVAGGGYSSVSEYVRELVRADQKHKAKTRLEEMMLESINSGEPLEVTPEMWERLRQNVGTRSKRGKSSHD